MSHGMSVGGKYWPSLKVMLEKETRTLESIIMKLEKKIQNIYYMNPC